MDARGTINPVIILLGINIYKVNDKNINYVKNLKCVNKSIFPNVSTYIVGNNFIFYISINLIYLFYNSFLFVPTFHPIYFVFCLELIIKLRIYFIYRIVAPLV